MNDANSSSSPFAPLLAAQLEELFSYGVARSFLYHRAGVANVSFLGVVDQFPTRLWGVNPGDVRVRVRANDLETILSPGPSDYITDSAGIATDVLSSAWEFGGQGVALQCRRRVAVAQAQAQAQINFISFPCITRAGRDALANPIVGMAIFQTDNTPGLRFFNGVNWLRYSELIDA